VQFKVRSYLYCCLTFSSIFLIDTSFRANVAQAIDGDFVHEISLHPMTQMPSTITIVPRGDFGGQVDQIRALLVLDGALLAIKLHPQNINVGPREESNSLNDKRPTEFKGSFPTPAESLSYQFQIILKGGRSQLTERFEVSPDCPGFEILDDMDRETKIMLMAQQQNKRLVIARDLLKLEIKKLENK
jgi:hypothetical protein